MLHIIASILKIMGIIIGILLAILLILLLLVLFVPVRYKFSGHKYQDINLKARVSWLLRIVTVHVQYTDQVPFYYQLRIFGIPFVDSRKPKKEKVRVKREKIPKGKSKKVKHEKKNVTCSKIENKPSKTDEVVIEEIQSPVKQQVKKLPVLESVEDNRKAVVKEEDRKEDKREQRSSKERKGFIGTRFIRKVSGYFSSLLKKIKNFFQIIGSFLAKLWEIRNKIGMLKEFYHREENKKGIKVAILSIKKLFKHIMPYRVKGQIHFGLSDPCNTGYALGALSLVYPLYDKKIVIQPDFTEEVLEGQLTAYGRVQTFTVLVIVLKFFFNEHIKKLWSNFNELKDQITE